MGRTLLIFGAVLVLLGAVPCNAAVFNPKTKTLANGLQVIVVENHQAPVVTHMMWIGAGAADEPYGTSGIAHYLEHLMFKATKNRLAGSYSKMIAGVGGTENAFTSADYTAYFATVAKENLPLVMELEADRFANLQFDQATAKPELAVVMDEKRQRVDSDPYALFGQQIAAALNPNHPYGKPVIGWEPEIEKLTATDAEAFYRRWYRPSNAVLVVSGDVEAAAVFAQAEKYYGGWKGDATPPRTRAQNPPFTGAVRIDAKEKRVRETLVSYGMKMPSRRLDGGLSYALEVLQEMIAGSEASFLPRRLVQEKKLASSIDMGYDADRYDDSALSITMVPHGGIAPDALLAALQTALRDYAALPVDEKELGAAKQTLKRQAVLARDSVAGPAYAFGMALSTGGTVQDVENWPDKIAAVTPEQIKVALNRIIESPAVIGVIESAPGAKADATAAPPPSLDATGPMR